MEMIEIGSITEVLNHLGGLEAVIFDLDDTLYNERDYVHSGYKAIERAFPQYKGIADELWQAFLRGEAAIDSVLKEFGLTEDSSLKADMLSVYRSHFPDICLSEEARNTLATLRQKNLLMGLITDGRPEGQWNKIKALDIADFFKKIIVTDELFGPEFRKPNPRAFECMRHALNIPYDKLCYVGDNPKKDIPAPTMLGMRAFLYRNPVGLYSKSGSK